MIRRSYAVVVFLLAFAFLAAVVAGVFVCADRLAPFIDDLEPTAQDTTSQDDDVEPGSGDWTDLSSSATVDLSFNLVPYTGEALRPTVTAWATVSDQGDTCGLTEGDDYTVEYTDNIEIGQARVTIHGCGRYSGSASSTFDIVPQSVETFSLDAGLSSVHLSLPKSGEKNDCFYQIAVREEGAEGWKVRNDSPGDKLHYAWDLAPSTSYEVRVRVAKKVDDVLFCSDWSETKGFLTQESADQ